MKIRQVVKEAAFNKSALEPAIKNVAKILQSKLGIYLERIGGETRIYRLDESNIFAAMFVKYGTTSVISLIFEPKGGSAYRWSGVQYWNNFAFNSPADATIVIPPTDNVINVVNTVILALRTMRPGVYNISNGNGEIKEMATRTTEADFIRMCVNMYGEKANYLSMSEMIACAKHNDVQIPGGIRHNNDLKVDAHHWNLTGGPDTVTVNQAISAQTGVPVDKAPTDDPDVAELKQVGVLSRMASQGKLYLFGRNRKNHFYRVEGADVALAQLERMLARQIENGSVSDRKSMDEQYEELHDRVTLVAGGKSQFIKSLLIMGAPSSGKTFTVMKTIKELGLQEGKDYMVKKGRVTTLTLYRALIEQIDGLLIFDDCDSVVEDKNAVNMLKGALDTDAVRELSYDVRGTTNVAVMAKEERDAIVDAMSRILRGKPLDGDLEMFKDKLKKGKKKKKRDDEDEYSIDADDEMDWDDDDDYEGDLLGDVQQYVASHLPNKIDFRGRIIFISNMDESEWDDAIITRALTMNMDFSSEEMLNYIDRIKQHIRTPNLSEDQKQEVIDYLRELYVTGRLKRQINFRLVQQAFDFRLVDSWKKLIATL